MRPAPTSLPTTRSRPKRGKLTIVADDAEIIVKITGKTRTETYNGSERTVTGFTTDVGEKPISVALKAGHKAEAKGTNAGRVQDGPDRRTDFEATSDNYSNIKIEVVDGWLKIKPVTDEVTVTITGNNKTVKYNGAEQKVEGYTYKAEDAAGKAISNTQFTAALKPTASKAEATGTSVGTYHDGPDQGERLHRHLHELQQYHRQGQRRLAQDRQQRHPL